MTHDLIAILRITAGFMGKKGDMKLIVGDE
jgi:hypothetical protein